MSLELTAALRSHCTSAYPELTRNEDRVLSVYHSIVKSSDLFACIIVDFKSNAFSSSFSKEMTIALKLKLHTCQLPHFLETVGM